MQFPVYLYVGSLPIHPHFLFESLAYFTAGRLIVWNSARKDVIAPSQRSTVLIGGLLGALIGAKLLVILQHLDLFWVARSQFWLLFLQGKTVVGGLLGAVIGVELTKKIFGIKRSTGDVFVYPLMIATAIGRIGCFLTGLSDQTYGIATNLPWGVDFGDGISRHPTQIYEIIFLMILLIFLRYRSQFKLEEGDLFKFYLISYLSFRFLVDFLKPDFHPLLGISAIQIACLLALIYYHQSFKKLFNFQETL